MKLLVVEDHVETRALLARSLARDGHTVTTAASLAEARAVLAGDPVELVVLDLGLPDGSGLELCRELRDAGRTLPVLVLTAHGQVAERVAGLDAGADDYLGKPFAVAELRARVRALGRRGPIARDLVVRAPGTELRVSARRAFHEGREVPLTAREWAIVELLAAHRGRCVTRSSILGTLWEDQGESASASLDVLVARIRRKLGHGLIRTLRGDGYALGGDG